jgi:hypothetical protein
MSAHAMRVALHQAAPGQQIISKFTSEKQSAGDARTARFQAVSAPLWLGGHGSRYLGAAARVKDEIAMC